MAVGIVRIRQTGNDTATWPNVAVRGQALRGTRARARWRLLPRHALLLLLSLLAFGAINLLYLVQTSTVANRAYRIEQLRMENEELIRQNETLQLRIAEYESLSAVESTAVEKLGMQPATNFEYITVPGVQPDGTSPTGAAGAD